MNRTAPEDDVFHFAYWLKRIENEDLYSVQVELASKSGKMLDAGNQAIDIWNKKQQDERDSKRDSREIETLKIAKRAQLISAVAVIIAIGAVVARVLLAQGSEL